MEAVGATPSNLVLATLCPAEKKAHLQNEFGYRSYPREVQKARNSSVKACVPSGLLGARPIPKPVLRMSFCFCQTKSGKNHITFTGVSTSAVFAC